MSTSSSPRQGARRWISLRTVTAAVGVVVLIAAVLSVKVVSIEDVEANAPETFDPVAFAEDNYDEVIIPFVEANAVDLATLLSDLATGADPADFGGTSGSSSAYSFPVVFTAVAGAVTPPILPLTVEGVPADVTVVLQVGPALSGTALRDVTGTISFDQFTNQLEFQNVGTELNNIVRTRVLDGLDPAALAGKTISVTGVFLGGNPKFVSILPVSVEVLP